MSVWLEDSTNTALNGSAGVLISISVCVEPRFLEELLESLAHLPYPINPQIYHDAALDYVYADGRKESRPTTLVDFPAYAGWLPEVRAVLSADGFPADSLHISAMLDEIHRDEIVLPPPEGAAYVSVVCRKHAHPAAIH